MKFCHDECGHVHLNSEKMLVCHLVLFKLVSAEGGHAGFDASGSQSDEEQAHHGQGSEGEKHSRASETPARLRTRFRQSCNSHVEGHVVGGAVPVGVCDVVDGADGHDDLAQRVHDRQVDDGPVQRGESSFRQR